MNNTKTSLLTKQPAKYIYYGEAIAWNLIAWLNVTTSRAGKTRIIRLLQSMRKMRAERSTRRRHRLLLQLFDQLVWYQRRVTLVFTIDPRTEDWTWGFRVGTGRPSLIDGNTLNEGHALDSLRQLHSLRLGHKVRQCRCGRWFFARFEKSKYCSPKCQQADFRSTPAWRKRNAEHQRQWRKRNYG
jgi:hypothetical protein